MKMDDWRLLVATDPATAEALVSEVVEAWREISGPAEPRSRRLRDALDALEAAVVRPPGLWTSLMDAPGQAIVDPQYVEIQALRAELDALHYVTDERSRELDAARAHIAQLETALATADRAYEAARAFAEKYIGDDVPRGLVPVQYEDIVALDAVPAAEIERLRSAQRHADALSFPSGEAESYFVAGYSRGWEAALAAETTDVPS